MSAKLLSVLGAIGITAIGSYGAFQLSPWPMALVLRLKLDRGGDAVAGALEQYVPPGVAARLQQRYADDPAAYLDVFYPAAVENTDQALPTVVWVHGGSWVSGSKDQVANYLRILAAKGFTTVGVDYALAPGETYPAPVRQVNAALGYLQQHAAALHVDPSKYFLAGDSAGAQIAGQLANAISAPRPPGPLVSSLRSSDRRCEASSCIAVPMTLRSPDSRKPACSGHISAPKIS